MKSKLLFLALLGSISNANAQNQVGYLEKIKLMYQAGVLLESPATGPRVDLSSSQTGLWKYLNSGHALAGVVFLVGVGSYIHGQYFAKPAESGQAGSSSDGVNRLSGGSSMVTGALMSVAATAANGSSFGADQSEPSSGQKRQQMAQKNATLMFYETLASMSLNPGVVGVKRRVGSWYKMYVSSNQHVAWSEFFFKKLEQDPDKNEKLFVQTQKSFEQFSKDVNKIADKTDTITESQVNQSLVELKKIYSSIASPSEQQLEIKNKLTLVVDVFHL